MRKLLLFVLLAAVVAFAGDIPVQGVGYGVSEAQAIANAKREALAQGIGQTLISSTEVENFMVKRDLILTQTAGNVRSFEVLEKSQGSDGAWTVKIKAVVSQDGLKNDLKALMILKEAIGNPRVAFLITETNNGSSDYNLHKTVEMLLVQAFRDRSFDVVDPNATTRFRESAEAVAALGGDPAAAAKLGASVNAEVIIIGTAVATESKMDDSKYFQGTGMKSASASINLKAISVGNRRVLAAANASQADVHPNVEEAGNRAFTKAVNKKVMEQVSGSFFDNLVKAWQQSANDGGTFELTIKGVQNFGDAKSVKELLATVAAKVDQRTFAKPQLTVDVQYMGGVEDLCTQLDDKPTSNGKKLSVEGCQGSSVELLLK